VIERTTNRHDLVVQFLVGESRADFGVDVYCKRCHHREIVASLLLRLWLRPLGRCSGGERISRLRCAFRGPADGNDKRVSQTADNNGKREYYNLREARNQTYSQQHYATEKDCLRLCKELVDDVLTERLVRLVSDTRHDHASGD